MQKERVIKIIVSTLMVLNIIVFIVYLKNYDKLFVFVRINNSYFAITLSILVALVVTMLIRIKSTKLKIVIIFNIILSFFLMLFPFLKYLWWVIIDSGE